MSRVDELCSSFSVRNTDKKLILESMIIYEHIKFIIYK